MKTLRTEEEKMIKEIRGAVARGWCSKENSHKEMDSTLAEAISQEVLKLIDAKFTSDNNDHAATPTALPKLPSFRELNKYMNGWADKGTYDVIKKLCNFDNLEP